MLFMCLNLEGIVEECAKLTSKSDEELQHMVQSYQNSLQARARKFFGMKTPIKYAAAQIMLNYRKAEKGQGNPDYS